MGNTHESLPSLPQDKVSKCVNGIELHIRTRLIQRLYSHTHTHAPSNAYVFILLTLPFLLPSLPSLSSFPYPSSSPLYQWFRKADLSKKQKQMEMYLNSLPQQVTSSPFHSHLLPLTVLCHPGVHNAAHAGVPGSEGSASLSLSLFFPKSLSFSLTPLLPLLLSHSSFTTFLFLTLSPSLSLSHSYI